MPDILKHAKAASHAVKIPDVIFEPPVFEQEPEQEEALGNLPNEDTSQKAEEQAAPLDPRALQAARLAAPPISAPPPLTREELIELYRDELDALCAEETQRAYSDALQQKKGELRQLLGEIDQQMNALEQNQRDYLREYAKQLKYLALEIAEKFVQQKLGENELLLQRLVINTVGKVKTASWLSVELSDRLTELIGAVRAELEKPEYHGRAEVLPVSAPEDTVRVSTETGTTDTGISAQAHNLYALFEQADEQS